MDKYFLQMELHETIEVSHGLEVTRVPGGWIYHRGDYASMCFVPFSPDTY